jgi:hypothetical protein
MCSTCFHTDPSPIASTRAASHGLSNRGSDDLTAIAFDASAEGSFSSSLHPKFDNPPEPPPTVEGVRFSERGIGTKLSVFQEYWHKHHPHSRSDSVDSGFDGVNQGAKTRGDSSDPSVDCDAPEGWLGELYKDQGPVTPEESDHRSFSRAVLALSYNQGRYGSK